VWANQQCTTLKMEPTRSSNLSVTTIIHGVISQKIWSFINTLVRTPNLTVLRVVLLTLHQQTQYEQLYYLACKHYTLLPIHNNNHAYITLFSTITLQYNTIIQMKIYYNNTKQPASTSNVTRMFYFCNRLMPAWLHCLFKFTPGHWLYWHTIVVLCWSWYNVCIKGKGM